LYCPAFLLLVYDFFVFLYILEYCKLAIRNGQPILSDIAVPEVRGNAEDCIALKVTVLRKEMIEKSVCVKGDRAVSCGEWHDCEVVAVHLREM
jgi:hypothetical protein